MYTTHCIWYLYSVHCCTVYIMLCFTLENELGARSGTDVRVNRGSRGLMASQLQVYYNKYITFYSKGNI